MISLEEKWPQTLFEECFCGHLLIDVARLWDHKGVWSTGKTNGRLLLTVNRSPVKHNWERIEQIKKLVKGICTNKESKFCMDLIFAFLPQTSKFTGTIFSNVIDRKPFSLLQKLTQPSEKRYLHYNSRLLAFIKSASFLRFSSQKPAKSRARLVASTKQKISSFCWLFCCQKSKWKQINETV